MIYNIRQIGANIILANYVIPIDTPNFLGVFSGTCGQSKIAIIPNSECENVYELTITGVAESYEDLNSGEINFSSLGTWTLAIYFQASAVNLDPSLATLIETFKIQINGST